MLRLGRDPSADVSGLVYGLRRLYWRMERRIVPGLQAAPRQYEEALERFIRPSIRWLDVGCGRHLLGPWRLEAERSLVSRSDRVFGVDPDLASLRDNTTIQRRCLARVGALPFKNDSFDLVTANMVCEHLREPEREIAEIWRLLADGGLVLLHTPNRWTFPTLFLTPMPQGLKYIAAAALEGRSKRDVFPAYYRLNSSKAIRGVAARCGFDVVSIQMSATGAVFALVPPLAALELCWIRLISSKWAAGARPNIIAVLQKRAPAAQA
ncbi:MAG TPA: class I SAM-dependent methyltransferase [Gemmatimonadaceae bacterium]|nr:class I SAM-dependent methyltransferase [Gemmatimonadaceae bacterium]